MAVGPVKAGAIKDVLTGTSFSLKTGEVVGAWCPNFPFSILFSVLEPAGIPVFKCKSSGGGVSVEVDVNAKTNFESGYWKGILDAQGKTDGGISRGVASFFFLFSDWITHNANMWVFLASFSRTTQRATSLARSLSLFCRPCFLSRAQATTRQ